MSDTLSPDVVRVLVANKARFLAFLAPRVGGRDTAEEILQAAFVKGIERGAALRDDESAVAWFFRLLRNAVVDHYRHRAVEARVAEGLAKESVEAFETELEDAVCACVGELLPTLKAEYRDILRRIELEEAAVDEVARSLGISPNNVSVRLHRARQALKRQLEKTCGTCTEHGCVDCTCKKLRQ